MSTKQVKQVTANETLAAWLKANSKTVAEFIRETGYKSNYPRQLLMKNSRPITFEVLGRLLVVYGLDGPAVAMAEALRAQAKANGNGNGQHKDP